MIKELILKNRSFRRFHQDEPISLEKLRQLVDLARLSTYAARDTHLTLKLWEVFQYTLAQESMTDIFWNMEMPFVWTLLDMEENGMHVNSGAVSALRSSWSRSVICT